jgi:hypothetical protein
MKNTVRLTELTTSILNEIVRADAQFQINQRAAWEGLDESMFRPEGINLISGLSRQENLFVQEFTFEFGLVPVTEPAILATVKRWFGVSRKGYFYRMAPETEKPESRINVRIIIRRDRDKSIHADLETEPAKPVKKEEIYVTGLSQ